jgi:hypothetical protein
VHSGHEGNYPFPQIFACDVICAKAAISMTASSAIATEDPPAMSGDDATEVDHLIETDSRILDQVRKDLNQEYLRLMSRALQMSRDTQSGGPASQATAKNLSEKSN